MSTREITFVANETGEAFTGDEISKMVYKRKYIKIAELKRRFSEDPNLLSLNELYLIKNKRKGDIMLDLKGIGFYTSAKQYTEISSMHKDSRALLPLMAMRTSREGRLLYGNGHYIQNIVGFLKEFKISRNSWYRHIRNDFVKHQVLAIIVINGVSSYIVNPLFVFSNRRIDENTFIAFNKVISKYLSTLDYAILSNEVRGSNVLIEQI